MVQNCSECARLWKEYAAATHEHVRLEGKLQIATLSRDEETVSAVQPQVQEAAVRRQTLRHQILRHKAAAHPQNGVSAL